MRRIASLLLVLAGSALTAAPAPFLTPKPKPKPRLVNPYWGVDFSPLATAGRVNVSIIIKVRTQAGESSLNVSQRGQVNVGSIVNALSGAYFQKTDLVEGPAKSKMTIKSLKGQPITSLEVTMTGLAQNFSPVVFRPGDAVPPK